MKVRALLDSSHKIPAWLEWRICNPFEKIRNDGIDVDCVWLDIGNKLEDDVDILVLPRLIVDQSNQEAVAKWFEDIKSNGTRLIYEADDDIWSPEYASQLSKIYWKETYQIDKLIPILDILEMNRKAALWTLNQCDAMTVSTIPLQEYVEELLEDSRKQVYWVPNAVDIEKFKSGLNNITQEGDIVTIGWAGGRRAENDLDEMIEGWCRIAASRSNVRFVVGGWIPDSIKNNKWLEGKLITHEWKTTTQYASSMQVDIGCCAISDNPFNNRKSAIKSWEYSLAGAAVVAQGQIYRDEPTILVAENVDDWTMFLEWLVDSKDNRQSIQAPMERHVENYHNLVPNYRNWVGVYEDVTNNVVV